VSTDTQAGKRFWRENGEPDHYELAMAKVTVAFGEPTRESQRLWMDAARVHADLAEVESMRDLAASNRELAAAYAEVAAEMRVRRGA
jgi:hypothetical protein